MWGSVLSDQLGGSWRSKNLHAFEPLHAKSAEDYTWENHQQAPVHFVPPSEEAPDAIMDIMIDSPIGRPAGT